MRGISYGRASVSAERFVPLFRYTPRSSPLHRTPAPIKLIALIALAPAVFFAPVPILAAISGFLVLLVPLARIEGRTVLRSFGFILKYGAFVLIFRLIGKPLRTEILLPELREGLFYIWRLAAILTAGTVFYESTSGSEIRETLSLPRRFLIRLRPSLSRLPDIAFELSLTIIFIPRVFEVWTDLDRAWAARGGRLSSGRLRKMRILLPLLIIQLFEMAGTTARAIRNRSE